MSGLSTHEWTKTKLRRSLVGLAVLATLGGGFCPASAADPKVRIFSGTDEHWVPFQAQDRGTLQVLGNQHSPRDEAGDQRSFVGKKCHHFRADSNAMGSHQE